MTSRICGFLALMAILLIAVAFLPRAEAAPIPGKVAQVLNAKSFVLESGETVRLAGLQTPNVTEQTGKMRPGEPMGEPAGQALAAMIEGKTVTLQPAPESPDRHGRIVAFVSLADGRSVQQEMLKEGWAMVYVFADTREQAKAWLPLEQQARAAGKGIWADPYWQVRQAEAVADSPERYLLVEGVLRQAKKVGNIWFLNFGEDWKTDFTASIKAADYRAFFKKQDLTALEGKKLRLRGWVYRYNGSMMDIVLPEQIEAE